MKEIDDLKKQAEQALADKDLEKAKELLNQIKELKAKEQEVNDLSVQLDELTSKDDSTTEKSKTTETEDSANSSETDQIGDETDATEQTDNNATDEKTVDSETVEDDEIKKEKGEKRTMKEVEDLNTNTSKNLVKDFENYIRTEGTEKRSLDTTSGSVLVPVDVSTDVLELKDGLVDLSAYVTKQAVGTGQGKFPVAKRAKAILATKEELAEIAEIDDPLFIDVEYKCATRIGQIAFSNELIEDAAIDVVAYAKKQMQRMVKNTNNKNILTVLAKNAKVAAASADDLKKIVNVTLDPELDIQIVVNQDAYQVLDTLKDGNGRYLLQDSIAFASGKSLFGSEVIVFSNATLPTPSGKAGYIWIGDIAESVFMAQRAEITAEWEKFDNYSKGLSVGVRSDYQQIDKEAGAVVDFTQA